MLKISKDLSLPVDAVTQTFAVLAKRGVGKTHTASVMAEEMLALGQPIVVYDPTGAWWGLKSSADGKRPGYPIVIFGGEHADVPLEERAGETVATVIVEKRIPAILDCGLMRKGARIRFMTDFCETLYHKNREALHFFVDEAQTIAPQNLKAMPEAARLLGAMEDIILQGRRRGLGMTIISPRPAVVNMNLRSACEVIIAMQLVAPADRKVIQEWVDLHGDNSEKAKELLASLSSLKRGEAFVWSPTWLEYFGRLKFRERHTFDSSATPTVGQRITTPKSVAAIDLEKLGQEIQATVEKAKADDPKLLRNKIAELEKKLAAAATVKPETTVQRVEVPVLQPEQINDLKSIVESMRATADSLQMRAVDISNAITMGRRLSESSGKTASVVPQNVPRPVDRPQVSSRPVVQRDSVKSVGDSRLSKAERQILQALYWLRGEQATPAKVAFYSNYRASSGGFNNALSKLRTAGMVSGWQITPAGSETAEGLGVSPKPTGPELREWLRPSLSKAENTILDALCRHHPNRLSSDQLAAESGYAPSSGGFNNALSRLRSIDAAEGYERDGGTKASDVFFE